MSSKKEEEKSEKIIRGLLKLPPNRRCINCNNLGPQYVCTTFWTFVCTTCSGIHREFTHRVKSVSMAKFTSQEVEALQNGGNQRAIEKYLRDWDPQRQRLKDNSNAEKIRQFIKDVYVDKKYSVPKSSDKPPRDLQTIRSREEEIPRASSYHSYSQSPPYDYQYEERRYGKHAPALTRKPGSDKGLYEGKFSSFLSPTHSSDHISEDRLPNEGSNPRMSNYSASSEADHFKTDAQSPNFQKDMGNPFSQSSEDAIQVSRPQRTSFGSFGSLDSMSFKSESVGVVDVDSEPEQLMNSQHSLTSLGNLSVSQNSDGLDLLRQNVTLGNTNRQHPESLTPSVDLFQPSLSLTNQTMQNPQTSSLDLFSVMPQQLPAATVIEKSPGMQNPENGGWATFDTQNVEHAFNNDTSLMPSVGNSKTSVVPSSDGKSGGAANPLFLGSWSPFEEFATDNLPSSTSFWKEFSGSVQSGLHTVSSQWPSLANPSAGGDSSSISAFLNGSHQIVEEISKAMDTQSWNAFEDPTGQLNSQNALRSNEHLETQNPSDAFYHGDYSEPEDFTVEVTHKDAESLGMSLHVSETLDNFPMPVMGVAHKSASDFKPSNPFDQPNIEPSNEFQFWDMGSLDAALPNSEILTDFADDETHLWFTSGPGIPYVPTGPQGALGFMAGQAGNTVIPNMHAEGPVAHVGGNPFA
ncbi:hypothetical protein Leryth_012275 [Lithospermum erythrorhizon]|nr:hypothetical protein Leryth_012275 [Lithospermum erythrorhizon]